MGPSINCLSGVINGKLISPKFVDEREYEERESGYESEPLIS